jgi:hypothetical protein
MRLPCALILIAVLSSAAAGETQPRQSSPPLVGSWTGTVEEPGAQTPRYRVILHVAADQSGRPVATVRYEGLNCSGLWHRWNVEESIDFQEVITEDPGERCVQRMNVVVRWREGNLDVAWSDPGSDTAVATATLRRTR